MTETERRGLRRLIDQAVRAREVEQVAAPDESPGDFMTRLIERTLDGQFGRTWDDLHPAHQEIVTRSRFEDCRSQAFQDIAVSLDHVEVKEVYDDPIEVEGIPERTLKAVTVRIVASNGEEVTDTGHAVLLDGRWRWVLTPKDIDTYQAGECPE